MTSYDKVKLISQIWGITC